MNMIESSTSNCRTYLCRCTIRSGSKCGELVIWMSGPAWLCSWMIIGTPPSGRYPERFRSVRWDLVFVDTFPES